MKLEGEKCLIVVAGPTAVGKTDIAIRLAEYFKTEIISADSRQFYKEMNIGTAKPTKIEMKGIVHHFVDSHSIAEDYSVGDFEKEALKKLDEIFKTKRIAVLVGGSGLYIKTICEGLDEMPDVDPEIREKLQYELKNEGLEILYQKLQKLDPDYAEKVDPKNPQRIMRALEVCISTGLPYSSFRKGTKTERGFKTVKIGLYRDREELYERIDRRMNEMLKQGLVDEAKILYAFKEKNALQTVGYQEVFDYLDEKYDYEEMVRLLKRNSRRYAKRQLTWFRRDEEFMWFLPNEWEKMVDFVNSKII